jgi:cytochrome oxidase Cu insertion factor (SCO1/SenC/PrrC family)
MSPNATPPDEPLALTVHSLATPDLAEPQQAQAQRTRSGRLKMLLVLLVCASPVIASYLSYFVIRPEGRTNYGELVLPTRELPASLPLKSLDGGVVPPASLRGQWLLVVVMPSTCDAACEKRLLTQRQLREMLGRESARLDKLVLVADDGPIKPELQSALLAAPTATVLRAPREALAQWLAPATGRTLDEHLYVVDPMGQWMMRMPPGAEPQKMMRDLSKLLRASASWDTPGR